MVDERLLSVRINQLKTSKHSARYVNDGDIALESIAILFITLGCILFGLNVWSLQCKHKIGTFVRRRLRDDGELGFG